MDLNSIRTEIDRVDKQLMELLKERFALVEGVAEYKRENNLPVYAPEREKQILNRVGRQDSGGLPPEGLKLLFGIIMDLNKLNEYRITPKKLEVPTGMGGASVRAILPGSPGALCRYLSALAAAEVYLSNISSTTLPGGKLAVDMELHGKTDDPKFMAALSVLSDTAEQFMLL